MGQKQSKKIKPPSVAAQPAAAPRLRPLVSDHLTRRQHDWPHHADGYPFTCAEVAAGAMRSCGYIALARAFGVRWLQQQMHPGEPFPLCLTRALSAAAAAADDACVCAHVSAAARVRVRCGEITRVAVGLATNSEVDQGAVQLCKWAACIATHVYGAHCRQVEVLQCP